MQDRLWMAEFDRVNRDSFIGTGLLMSLVMLFSCLFVVGVLSVVFVLSGVSWFVFCVGVFVCAVWFPILVICGRELVKCRRGARECQVQLANNLLAVFPEYGERCW